VFSFGVLAYRVLTGRQPHVEAPLHARMYGRDILQAAPIASLLDGISPELAQALDDCLSTWPGERPEVETLLRLVRKELAQLGGVAPMRPG
jgi:hypothetical protein